MEVSVEDSLPIGSLWHANVPATQRTQTRGKCSKACGIRAECRHNCDSTQLRPHRKGFVGSHGRCGGSGRAAVAERGRPSAGFRGPGRLACATRLPSRRSGAGTIPLLAELRAKSKNRASLVVMGDRLGPIANQHRSPTRPPPMRDASPHRVHLDRSVKRRPNDSHLDQPAMPPAFRE